MTVKPKEFSIMGEIKLPPDSKYLSTTLVNSKHWDIAKTEDVNDYQILYIGFSTEQHLSSDKHCKVIFKFLLNMEKGEEWNIWQECNTNIYETDLYEQEFKTNLCKTNLYKEVNFDEYFKDVVFDDEVIFE